MKIRFVFLWEKYATVSDRWNAFQKDVRRLMRRGFPSGETAFRVPRFFGLRKAWEGEYAIFHSGTEDRVSRVIIYSPWDAGKDVLAVPIEILTEFDRFPTEESKDEFLESVFRFMTNGRTDAGRLFRSSNILRIGSVTVNGQCRILFPSDANSPVDEEFRRFRDAALDFPDRSREPMREE